MIRSSFLALLVLSLAMGAVLAADIHRVAVEISVAEEYATVHLDEPFSQFENSWGASNSDRRFVLRSLPEAQLGRVYQTVDGKSPQGDPITTVDTVVSHPEGLVVFQRLASTNVNIEMDYTIEFEGSSIREAGVAEVRVFQPCAGVPVLVDGFHRHTVSPPIPKTTIRWLPGEQKISFHAETAYIRDEGTYLIDMADFDPAEDTLRQSTTCQNRAELVGDWEDAWESAPSALFPQALTGAYSAYPESSFPWTVSSDYCDRVDWDAKFSFSRLMSCQTRGMSPERAIRVNQTSDELVYEGSLYVNALFPADLDHENYGYSKFRTEFPWRFSFQTHVHATVGMTTEKQLVVFVRSVSIDADGDLQLILVTHYPGTGLGPGSTVLEGGIVLTSSSGTGACVANSPADDCAQTWVYNKPVWDVADNGEYTFQWPVINQDGHVVSALITIIQELQELQEETGLVMGEMGLRLFNAQADAVLGQNPRDLSYVWSPNDLVYVRADLALPEEDQLNFELRMINLWVCYSSVEGYTIEYGNGKKGCLDAMIKDDERVQLVGDYAALENSDTVFFEIEGPMSSEMEWESPLGPSAGLAFRALPLTKEGRVWTIHAETVISQVMGNKRSVEYVHHVLRHVDEDGELENSSSVARLRVAKNEAFPPEMDGDQSGSPGHLSLTFILASAAGLVVCIAVSALAIAFVVVAARRIRKRREDAESRSVDIELEEVDLESDAVSVQ